ncbi:hypothetical protein L227DRAFT_563927 [Lentinus tigrinus ALCF2SS1-6]|uniref:Uncharacterized protein n=1 Tax=Lentinus tigrinus ALCF2SS1-6 TaxID=1328759 RepID=A0A5C2S893_9APHY|nr:hypothetical protein L227DRAFT_563927 [Lentinus tigrinus ALCF2SS1-6]
MSTVNSLVPHLYLFADTPARRLGDVTNTHTLVLFVNGPVSTATFFLPTSSDLVKDSAAAARRVEEYLMDVRDGVLARCDANDEQEAAIRQLLLAYQAFYARVDSLDLDAYPLLTAMLVEAALCLEDHEPADDLLVEIVVWLHHIVPEAVFSPLLSPAETHPAQERNALPRGGSGPDVGFKQLVESNPFLSPHVHTPKEPSREQPSTSPISATPAGPPGEVSSEASCASPKSDTSGKWVPTRDPILRKMFPQGVPAALLEAIGSGTSISCERASSSAKVSDPSCSRPAATKAPRATVEEYESDTGSIPELVTVYDSDDETSTPHHPSEHDIATALFARMVASGCIRRHTVPTHNTTAASSSRRSAPPTPSTTSTPPFAPSSTAAPAAPSPTASVPSSDSAITRTATAAGPGEEGGYASDGSIPSLVSVSASSESDEEEYVDDDDEYYDL